MAVPVTTRRRLLTAVALSPLLWHAAKIRAASIDPHRVVALEWLPVELLFALGITPYGVADMPNYRRWVKTPSLLILSAGYGPSATLLSRIAPGWSVQFSDGRQPLVQVERSLMELANMLDKRPAALRHMAMFNQTVDRLAPRFQARGARVRC